MSDIALLKQAGFVIKAKLKNPRVKDRINAVNKCFQDMKLWINVKEAPVAASCLEQQIYDANGEPDKKSGQDHQNDATGYPISYEFPIIRPTFSVDQVSIY